MKIDVIEVEVKIQLLAMNFSNTFFNAVADNYLVVFNTSNVLDEMNALDDLSSKLAKKMQTAMIKKDSQMLQSIIECYTYLITMYKAITNIDKLPIELKRYDMIKFLQDWCKKTSGEELINWGKVFVDEVLNSEMAVKINSLAECFNPTMSKYKTMEERRKATVKAEISKMLIK